MSALERANEKIITSEKRVEDQFTRTARTKRRADQEMATSAETTAQAVQGYDLADERVASSALRFGVTTGRRGNVRGYGIDPLPAAVASAQARAVAQYSGGAIPLADEFRGSLATRETQMMIGQWQSRFSATDAASAAQKAAAMARAGQQSELDLLRFQNRMEADREDADQANAFRAKVGRGVRTGLMAVTAAGFAGIGYAEQLEQHYQAMSAGGVAFERDVTPYLGLGDNAQHARAIKELILGQSGAMGMTTEQIGRTSYNVQSMGSNLTAEQRAAIVSNAGEYSRAHGAELNQTAIALTKMQENYGDQFKGRNSIPQMANILGGIQERSAVNPDELSTLLPDVLPVAKELGASLYEVGGSLAVITERMGRNEKAFTGFRNVMLELNKADEHGIHLTGNFTDKLQQLHDMLGRMSDDDRRSTLQNLFGQRSITAAAVLLNNISQMRAETEALSKIDLSNLDKLFTARLNDPGFASAERNKRIDAITANIPATRLENDPTYRHDVDNAKLIRLGAERLYGPEVPDVMKNASVGMQVLSDKLGIPNPLGNNLRDMGVAAELEVLQNNLKTGGKSARLELDAEKLRLGQFKLRHEVAGAGESKSNIPAVLSLIAGGAGAPLGDNSGWLSGWRSKTPLNLSHFESKPTGVDEANRFLRWNMNGAGISGGDFADLLQSGIDDPSQFGANVLKMTRIGDRMGPLGYSVNASNVLGLFDSSDNGNGWRQSNRTGMRRVSDFGTMLAHFGENFATGGGLMGNAAVNGEAMFGKFHAVANMLHSAAVNLHAASKAAHRVNPGHRG